MRVLWPQLPQALRLQDTQRLLLPEEKTTLVVRRFRHSGKHVVACVKVRHFVMTLTSLK
jgi:hypothetical protein